MGEQRVRASHARRAQPPPRRRGSVWSTLVTAAVTAIVVASGVTAYLLQQADAGDPEFAILEPVQETTTQGAYTPQKVTPAPGDVVTAPALRLVLPTRPTIPANDDAQQGATHVMGAAPACPNCGIVETVVAVHEYGQAQPRGYQMLIRMDDGTVRTIAHRGALAAGSRVAVEGAKLRPVAAP
jgi:hypothetical protein